MAQKFDLTAGALTITAKKDVVISIYVNNKDSIPCSLKKGDTIKVTTTSAGETFHYYNQASDDVTVTATAG